MSQNTPRTASVVDSIAESYASDLIDLDPILATTLGLPGVESKYPDFSPAGLKKQEDLLRSTLQALEGAVAEDFTDRVTLDAMRERLGLELELLRSWERHSSLNNIASPAQEIRAIFDLMPQESEEDLTHIAQRMLNIPQALSGYSESLSLAARHGRVSARRQINAVIEQCSAYAEQGGFFDAWNDHAGVRNSPKLRDAFTEGSRAAREAYSALVSFLQDELLPQAPEADGVGPERYRLASRYFLGMEIDFEETYAWGIRILKEIVEEQEAVAEQIKPGASIDQAKEILRKDPSRILEGTEALQAWMQKLSDDAIQALSREQFDIPDPLKRLECKIAPTQEGGVYYTGPSSDFSRPGRMWWSVPAGEDRFDTWSETSTVYHEGVPGHHLQIGTATYLKDSLNSWRRDLCWTSGFGEGWALYAERLMDELGFLSDPAERLGMLDQQRVRAARVVFDLGMHLDLELPLDWQEKTGSTRWTPEIGRAFIDEHLEGSEGVKNFEFIRYLGWPGQAPSYKIGQRVWDELRAWSSEKEGKDFDIKAFHAKALALGSLPLSTLRRAMREDMGELS